MRSHGTRRLGIGHDGAMFRHVVMFSWTDDVDEAHVAAVSAALDTLPGKIDVLRGYRHGPDVGISDGNFDYVVVADVDSADDFAAYRDHPDHVAVIQQVFAGKVAQRAAVQYELD
jgi:hypothetical protein